jgi:hypothetical protein
LQLHRLGVDHLPLTGAVFLLAGPDLLEEGPEYEHLAGDQTAACLAAARLKLIDIADPAVTLVIEIPVILQNAGRELHLHYLDTETPRGPPVGIRRCLDHSKPVTFRELDIVLLRLQACAAVGASVPLDL